MVQKYGILKRKQSTADSGHGFLETIAQNIVERKNLTPRN
jgi:hypothetical protein